MTIVDSDAGRALPGRRGEPRDALRRLLNAEARDLAAAGADVIQFDEPCFNIYLDKVKAWGIRALEAAIDGVTCTTAIHICYSYGIPRVLAWKTQNTEWGQYGVTLPLLRETRIDQISVECAASGVDVAVLKGRAGKDVLLGVIDVGTEEVESPELVADADQEGAPVRATRPPLPCTDCGLVPRSRHGRPGEAPCARRGRAARPPRARRLTRPAERFSRRGGRPAPAPTPSSRDPSRASPRRARRTGAWRRCRAWRSPRARRRSGRAGRRGCRRW